MPDWELVALAYVAGIITAVILLWLVPARGDGDDPA